LFPCVIVTILWISLRRVVSFHIVSVHYSLVYLSFDAVECELLVIVIEANENVQSKTDSNNLSIYLEGLRKTTKHLRISSVPALNSNEALPKYNSWCFEANINIVP
jgi:hypothetical protein